MKIAILQNRFGITKFFFLCVLFILVQFLTLQSFSKSDEVNVIQQHREVINNKMNNLKSELEYTSETLKNIRYLTNNNIVQGQQVEQELKEELQFYSTLNHLLEKASVQLTFYGEYNEKYFDAKINYLTLLLENVSSINDIYVQLPSSNHMNLWHEVIELNMLQENRQINHHLEIHHYNRIYLNFISHWIIFLFLANFVFEMNFISLKKHGWTSFIPKNFKTRFKEHYGGMIKRFVCLFLLSVVSYFSFLYYKGLELTVNEHSVLLNSIGHFELYNFSVLVIFIIVGWLLVIITTCLIKDMLSLLINESIIASLISIMLFFILYTILSNFDIGINAHFLSRKFFYISYGFVLPMSNIIKGFCIITIFDILLIFLLKINYPRAF